MTSPHKLHFPRWIFASSSTEFNDQHQYFPIPLNQSRTPTVANAVLTGSWK